MEQTYNILLHDGADQNLFLQEVVNGHYCQCVDECNNIPNVLVMKMDKEHAEELKNHPLVKEVAIEYPMETMDLPNFYSKNKTFTAEMPSLSEDPRNFGPLQFYYLNDQVKSNGQKIGAHRWVGAPLNDDTARISGRYVSCWLGKNVDIVTLEAQDTFDNNILSPLHPDFTKIGTASTSRVIPTNWPGLVTPQNIDQVGNTDFMSRHAIGVLSAAGGTICGYAKKSDLYVAYIESVTSSINSIISWHNSKSVNPETGLKNPTILVHPYGTGRGNNYFYKIQNISQFTYYNESTKTVETITRPVGGWGTDFTPFTSRNFNIKRVIENGFYHWCIAVSSGLNSSYIAAIKSAYDNGITNIISAGNDCSVFVKTNDPNFDSTITVESGATYFEDTRTLGSSSMVINQFVLASNTVNYPFRHTGPKGSPYSIDVAAGQNSETFPILDHYSARGPGIDIIGLGARTYTCYPSSLMADGNYWGLFSGTSCAAPTVAGILACLFEKYYYYHNAWPTPAQAKEILLSEAKKGVLPTNIAATTWANVPSASTPIKGPQSVEGNRDLMQVYDGVSTRGGISHNELVGTPNVRAFIDTSINKINLTQNTRPVQGQVYPRVKIKVS